MKTGTAEKTAGRVSPLALTASIAVVAAIVFALFAAPLFADAADSSSAAAADSASAEAASAASADSASGSDSASAAASSAAAQPKNASTGVTAPEQRGRVAHYAVNCLLNGTDEAVAAPRISLYHVGETVSVAPPAIDGYTAVSAEEKPLKVAADGASISFYYYRNVTLSVDGVAEQVVYDGKDHRATYSVVGGLPGHEPDFSAVKLPEAYRDAGTYDVAFPEGAVGTVDATETYIVERCIGGSYTVNPAPLSVTTPTAFKAYDGKPLSAKKGASLKGLVNGEQAGFEAIGSQTEAGSSANTYRITWAGEQAPGADGQASGAGTQSSAASAQASGASAQASAASQASSASAQASGAAGFTAKQSNYEITSVALGTLTVAGPSDGVVVATTGGSFTYDGKTHGATVTVSGLPRGYSVKAAKSNTTVTAATLEPVRVTADELVILDESGADVTGELKVTYIDGSIEITPRPVRVRVVGATNDTSIFYDGNEHEVSGYEARADDELYEIGQDVAFSGLARVRRTDAGSASMGLVPEQFRNVNPNFEVTFEVVDGSITIKKATSAVLVGSVGRGGWTYGDADVPQVSASVHGENNYADPSIEYKAPNSADFTEEEPVDAGTYLVRAVWGGTDNCESTVAVGSFTIAPAAARVIVPSAAKVYDGKPLSVEGTLELAGGETASLATMQVTDATDGPVQNSFSIEWDGTAKEGNYVVTSAEVGTLTVAPAPLAVTTSSASKAADDEPLTSAEASVTGFAEGETAGIEATGSQTEVGSSENTYELVWDQDAKGAAKPSNYVVASEELGTLTVTDGARVVVTTTGGSFTYDGREHGASVLVSGLPDGYKVVAAESGATAANVADGRVRATADKLAIEDASGADVTSKLDIVYSDGEIAVGPAPLSVESPSASRFYDGAELAVSSGSMHGLVEGETAALHVSGAVADAGEKPVSYEIAWDGSAVESNYAVEAHMGTVKILPKRVYVVVGAAAKEFARPDPAFEAVLEAACGELEADGKGAGGGLAGAADAIGAASADNAADAASGASAGAADAGGISFEFTRAAGEDVGDYLVEAAVAAGAGTGSGAAAGNGNGNGNGAGAGSGEAAAAGADAGNPGNYEYVVVPGVLSIAKNTADRIVLTAPSVTKVYDGEPLTASSEGEGIKLAPLSESGVPEGYAVQDVTYAGSITCAGYATSSVAGYSIVDGDGVDKKDSFNNVRLVPGMLSVQKRSVTLTSASGEKAYDGDPLVIDQVSVGGDGFVEGEEAGVSYQVAGTQTIVGNSPNNFSYAFDPLIANAANYDVRQVLGTLVVTSRFEGDLLQISVKAKSDSVLYDGSEKTVEGLEADTFSIDGETYRVEGLSAFASGVDAGTYQVVLEGTAVVRDSNNNDVTGRFHVSESDGVLEIRQRSIAFESESAEKAYDGTPLTNETVAVKGDGFAAGEGATFDVVGSQTTVGSSANEFAYAFDAGTKEGNYNIAYPDSFGTLTVTSRDARYELTVEAASGEFLYDGTVKSVEGLKSRMFELDGVIYLVEGLSAYAQATDAGTYSVGVVGKPLIRDMDGNDVTSQFAVKTAPGQLKVNRRAITLTSASPSRPYDGRPLRDDSAVVEGDGFALGEGASFDATGLQILPGSAANPFTYALSESTDPDNYQIDVAFGRISVTNAGAPHQIELQAIGGKARYDGEEHRVDGFEVLSFDVDGETYAVEGVEAHAAGTEPGVYTTEISGTPRVLDSAGNDVTGQFAVTVKNGTLTVSATRQLTVEYRSGDGAEVAPPYVGRYEPGERFGPVPSPKVEGYQPQFASVSSGWEGMPDRDVAVEVTYFDEPPEETGVSVVETEYGEAPESPFANFLMTPSVVEALAERQEGAPDAMLVVSHAGNVSLARVEIELLNLGDGVYGSSSPVPLPAIAVIAIVAAAAAVAVHRVRRKGA